jgi:hypothetical protein
VRTVANGVTYTSATVLDAYLASPFRRLYDYARVTANLALSWVSASVQIP